MALCAELVPLMTVSNRGVIGRTEAQITDHDQFVMARGSAALLNLRNGNCDFCARARRALKLDASLHRIDRVADDCESEPGPARSTW